ncbi:MAG TPA: hypothetical protein VGP41_03305 [Candidatus Lustribacter sp.]|nr:hypothetical protein [Candidatus Lustribacter sp.]
MKIAVSSAVFAALLRRGALTHLEWLEGCASRLDVDGALFALADFPRTDVEYAAQIKKVATDLAIVPVALDVPGLLDPERPASEGSEALALATAIGAALIAVTAGPPGELPPQTFARTVEAAKRLSSAAKAANVTLAVAPAADSLLADLSAVQTFCKYVDSAWLRYNLPVERVSLDADLAPTSRRGWLVLEGDGGDDPFARVSAAVERIRGQRPQMPSVVPG